MKYFIVADIHSHYDILREVLDEKGFSPDSDHILVLLGDAFDRGGQTCKTADFLLSLHDKGKLIFIYGNHEELLVKCLQQLACGDDPADIAMSYHARNGTWQTLLELAEMTEDEAIKYPRTLISKVMSTRAYRELLPSCIDYYETKKYIFVHGYVPCYVQGIRPREAYAFDSNWREAPPEDWRRARWSNGAEIACKHGVRVPDKTVVCGHWHTSYAHHTFEKKCSEWGEDADFSPFFSADGSVIAIDACTAYSGKMNCLVFDEDEL